MQASEAECYAAAKNVEDAASGLNGDINAVMNEGEVLKSGWQGQAANSFQRLLEAWREDVKCLQNSLMEISNLLHESGKAIGEVERANTANN